MSADAAAADVARLWGKGEACALTGIVLPRFLIASHIRPWRDAGYAERRDPTNVLLLAVHVDKLFGRHLLSFENQAGDLRTVIAPRAQPIAAKLGVRPGTPLTTAMFLPSSIRRVEQYVPRHLAQFQRKKVDVPPSS